MQIDISVIIPLYNTQKYIGAALQSVLAQSKKNVQLIVVDDGSTDESVKIVGAFQKEHNSIELYRQKNAGPASARNHGMKRAKGKYLMFMDSDDLLPPDALEDLYVSISKNSAEITIGMMISFRGARQWIPKRMQPFIDLEAEGMNLGSFPELINNVSPCNKLYRKDFILKYTLHFFEDAHLSEDLYFVVNAFLNASSVNVIPNIVYNYRGREAGEDALTDQISSQVFEDIVTVSNLLDKQQEASHYKDVSQCYHDRYVNETNSIVYRLWPYVQMPSDAARTLLLLSDYLNKVGDKVIMLMKPMESIVLYKLKQRKYDIVKKLIIAEKKKKRTYISKLKDKTYSVLKEIFWAGSLSVAPLIQKYIGIPEKLWLIGEQHGNVASDTGYQFFLYCRKVFPEKPIYFVTKKENISAEVRGKVGNIIEYGSRKNFLFALKTEVYIFSDGYKDIFPYWSRIKSKSHLQVSVFLQHGIFAFKRSEYYHSEAVAEREEKIDIFVVSSEKEKAYVSNDFNYPENIMAVTGLSRFDRLYKDRNHPRRKKILFVPTWRTDLRYATDEMYLDSTYHHKLLALFQSDVLTEVLQTYGYALHVCFHHAAAKFTKHYSSIDGLVTYSDMDKVDLYEELIHSCMLVTDYSSVAFNMAYIDRPVVFYQFDREEFLVVEGGSFMDYDTELFGIVSDDPVQIIAEIKYNIENDFIVRPKYQNIADTFFTYKDDHNSERIFNAIELKINEGG